MSNDKKCFKFNFEITKRTKIIWGIAIALSIIYAVMCFMEPSPPPRPAKVESLKGTHGKPVAKEQININENEVKTVPSAEKASLYPEGGAIASGGNLSERTTLRADIELLELQVKKKELLDKLNPPAPAPVSAPAITPGLLALPPISPPVSGNEPAEPVRKTSSSATVVVAVQGVDNNLSAVIRTGGRLVSVRKGQNFGGGVITNISRNAVAVRIGNKTSILPFE
jgi:type IV pilus biogenesis protein PilP